MSQHNLRILLVEDHPFQLKATQSLLHSYGFTCLTVATSATDALLQLEQSATPFDLLICDQCLPDLPGLELISAASHRGLARQAILLSSLTSPELEALSQTARQRQLPLLGYLIKPLQQVELHRLLGSLYQQPKCQPHACSTSSSRSTPLND
ncbi:response regulator [Pseudomonas sp. SZMC_28357]|uniref:response regulator n=1 Tax=Pseudomonas sp. SZMC_28357 TaxID=3074380 RepID=UPI0028720A71|nr:response regulator [Pseudomonas sp. SZMC_28357]MDR9753961.1 response regulator [Pseudomonas sp. SZMC_28357]